MRSSTAPCVPKSAIPGKLIKNHVISIYWNEKKFSGKSTLGLDLRGCRYANMARLANKAIFFKQLHVQCHFGIVHFGFILLPEAGFLQKKIPNDRFAVI